MRISNRLRPKLVTVRAPTLIGPRGGTCFLDNRPIQVAGRNHVELHCRRTQPPPLFSGSPLVDWASANSTLRSPLWGEDADAARASVKEVVRQTARRMNIRVVDDEANEGLRSGRVVRRPPLNVIHVRDIEYISTQIVGAVRHYHEWSLAWAKGLAVPRRAGRPIVVEWQTYDADTTTRLRSLLRAADRGTRARLELQWYQTPSAARSFIWRAAGSSPRIKRKSDLASAVVPGEMISAPIPSRDFLRAVLPEAMKISARQRGHRVDGADVLLAVIREMFLMVVGDGNDRLRVGRFEIPNGEGADFAQEIEALFDVRLLNVASLHAIRRVRKLNLPMAAPHGPYLRSHLRDR